MLTITLSDGNTKEYNLGEEGFLEHWVRNCIYILLTEKELDHVRNIFCPNYTSHPLDRRFTIPIPPYSDKVFLAGDIAKTVLLNAFPVYNVNDGK